MRVRRLEDGGGAGEFALFAFRRLWRGAILLGLHFGERGFELGQRLGLDRGDFLVGDGAELVDLVGENIAEQRMRADLLVKIGLGERGLVELVVAVAAGSNRCR